MSKSQLGAIASGITAGILITSVCAIAWLFYLETSRAVAVSNSAVQLADPPPTGVSPVAEASPAAALPEDTITEPVEATLADTATPTFTPSPTLTASPLPTSAPAAAPTSTPRPTARPVIQPTATPVPSPTPGRESLAPVITIGDCNAIIYHLGPMHTGLRGGMVAEMATSPLWSPVECGSLSIARCMVQFFNPQTVILFLNDGGFSNEADFIAGNQLVINHIREFEGSNVTQFVVIGPPNIHVSNPFGPGVVVVDLKDVTERAQAHGINLMEGDGVHLRPVLWPYEEEWQFNYAYRLFDHLFHRAMAIGQGVVSIEEEFFIANPYTP